MTYKELKYICERYDRAMSRSGLTYSDSNRGAYNMPFEKLVLNYQEHKNDSRATFYLWGIIERINNAAVDLCYDENWDTGYEESVRMTYEGCKAFDEEYSANATDIAYDGKIPQEVIDAANEQEHIEQENAELWELRELVCSLASNEMNASRQEIEEIYDTLYP
jgi:hypothetical protein